MSGAGDSQIPAQFASALSDRYRLERELGQGGMATVYLAEDLKHRRRVAIKVLRPELAAVIGPERFHREIQTIAKLQHPHVLGLIDSGEARVVGHGSWVEGGDNPATHDPRPTTFLYYVMPFIEGESLGDRLAREKRIPVSDALRIAMEVAGGLSYAHTHGIIHRDLKPDNILLTNGHALVADFGIALPLETTRANRLTETGLVVGTPGYMSPEQAAGDRSLDGRSDLFALGCVLYESLAGVGPFEGPTAQARMQRTLAGHYTPIATVRPECSIVDPLLAQLLAADIKARPHSAAAVVETVENLRRSTGGNSRAGQQPVVSSTRRPLIAAAVIGLVILAAALYWRSSSAAAEPAGLAIVPFQTIERHGRDSALAVALVPGMATRLALLPGLEISASRAIGGTQSDSNTAEISRYALRVGARFVLTGNLRWEDSGSGAIQLQPRLLELAAGTAPVAVWSDSFSVAPTQLFQAEIRITHGIAKRLRRAPRGDAAIRLDSVPTRVPAAYLEYLEGVMAFDVNSTESRTRIERAVSLDPNFTLAWAALSAKCSVQYRQTQTPVSRDCAERGAERAMALDSNLAATRYAAGLYARHVLGDFSIARSHLERATDLAPWDAASSSMLVAVLMSLGEWSLARAPAFRAEALEPRDIQGALRVADLAITQGQYTEANAALDRALKLDSIATVPLYLRSLALVQQGDLAGAQQALGRAPYQGPRLEALVDRGVRYGRIWFYAPSVREEVLAAPAQLFESYQGRQLLTFAQVHWLAGRFDRARQSALLAIPWARLEAAASPDNDEVGMRLAFALALAGQRAEAMKEGSRSSNLRPVGHDARVGPFTQLTYAEVLTVAGAQDSAVAVLKELVGRPGPATPGWVAVDPFLAPLAKTAGFEAITGR